MKKRVTMLMLGLCSLTSVAKPIEDFISSDWLLPTGNAQMTHFNGRESLYIQKGVALFGEEQMQDGILEVDVADDNARGFAGLVFHHNGNGTYEEVYVRLHKSNQPDALQYTPIYHHSTSWQLYPEHQAAAPFQPQAWTHLKVVVQGTSAKVYLNHSAQPTLVVPELKLKNKLTGKVGVKALNGAFFSNFRFTPLPASLPAPAALVEVLSNTILHWQVSSVLAANQTTFFALPNLKQLTWETLTTEPTGLLNVAAHRQKQGLDETGQTTHDYVWVKLDLTSDRPQLRQFFFEYTNKAQVYLNRQPFFLGDNSFRAKGDLYRGDIDKSLQSNALFLPLRQGKNTILIALSSKDNGWALMGRFDKMTGITLQKP